jgi:hypothetical protein
MVSSVHHALYVLIAPAFCALLVSLLCMSLCYLSPALSGIGCFCMYVCWVVGCGVELVIRNACRNTGHRGGALCMHCSPCWSLLLSSLC